MSEVPARRRGPRATGAALRDRILAAASTAFAELGYQGASVRHIAGIAGVDAKLVHYYFGTKSALFSAAIGDALRQAGLPGLLTAVPPGPGHSPGTGYLRAVLGALDRPGPGAAFLGLVRTLGSHEESRQLFLRLVAEQLLPALLAGLPGHCPEARAALAGSQLLGIVMARYVLRVEAIMALSNEQLAAALGPALDRVLFDPEPGAGPGLTEPR